LEIQINKYELTIKEARVRQINEEEENPNT
jgi:hypothetical protein